MWCLSGSSGNSHAGAGFHRPAKGDCGGGEGKPALCMMSGTTTLMNLTFKSAVVPDLMSGSLSVLWSPKPVVCFLLLPHTGKTFKRNILRGFISLCMKNTPGLLQRRDIPSKWGSVDLANSFVPLEFPSCLPGREDPENRYYGRLMRGLWVVCRLTVADGLVVVSLCLWREPPPSRSSTPGTLAGQRVWSRPPRQSAGAPRRWCKWPASFTFTFWAFSRHLLSKKS